MWLSSLNTGPPHSIGFSNYSTSMKFAFSTIAMHSICFICESEIYCLGTSIQSIWEKHLVTKKNRKERKEYMVYTIYTILQFLVPMGRFFDYIIDVHYLHSPRLVSTARAPDLP